MTDINKQTAIEKSHNVATEDFFVYLYKKTERLVTAVYLVTNLIPDTEPLKWQMRHKTIGLLGELLPLKDITITDRVHARVLPLFSELLSLLEIGHRAELMSSMNAELLRKELNTIGTLLKERHEKKHEGGYLVADFFDRIAENTEDHHAASLLTESKRHELIQQEQVDRSQRQGVKDMNSTKAPGGKKRSVATSPHNEEAEHRRVKILAFLRERGDVSIKDISKVITGCSEKTLQRDLAQLVSDGLVKQYGKRRWTRYART